MSILSIIFIIIAIIVAFILGFSLAAIGFHGWFSGFLIINEDDPEKDLMKFEFSVPFGDMFKQKFVLFQVVNQSQEKQSL